VLQKKPFFDITGNFLTLPAAFSRQTFTDIFSYSRIRNLSPGLVQQLDKIVATHDLSFFVTTLNYLIS
jgi:hypothetical protein